MESQAKSNQKKNKQFIYVLYCCKVEEGKKRWIRGSKEKQSAYNVGETRDVH